MPHESPRIYRSRYRGVVETDKCVSHLSNLVGVSQPPGVPFACESALAEAWHKCRASPNAIERLDRVGHSHAVGVMLAAPRNSATYFLS
jgi:hypothetical protein